jgi:nucleotide-binding universal stress UspA family protein
MNLSTLMVAPDLGRSNAALLQIAGDLALRFHASVVGVAAGQIATELYSDGYTTGALVQVDRDAIDLQIAAAETEFRAVLQPRLEYVGWRSCVTLEPAAAYLAAEARGADIVLVNAPVGTRFGFPIQSLLMQVGRPVLSIPAGITALRLDHVLVAWKDTREARRAVLDSLPLLAVASRVSVCEIAAPDERRAARDRVDDVTHWLNRHGVAAESLASGTDAKDTAALDAIAHEHKIDLIVAGAFGHSRLREWVLGGFTRHLLAGTTWCALVSH